MTVIKVMCPACGEQSLAAEQLLLRIGSDGEATYGFTCARCHDFVVRKAEAKIVQLLRGGGIAPVPSDIPAEVFEKHEGPPFTLDDVIDFHDDLKQLDRRIPFLGTDPADDSPQSR